MNSIKKFSDVELAKEINQRGLFISETKLIKSEIYEFIIAECLPIVCVDIVPVRKSGSEYEIGVIIRKTGTEAGKLAVLGGRIKKDSSIHDAVREHLSKDLKVSTFSFINKINEANPFFVQQYFHKKEMNGSYGYDPTKHAIALTYLIEINEKPIPSGEAENFIWISRKEIPTESAFNHHIVMKAAFDYLIKIGGNALER